MANDTPAELLGVEAKFKAESPVTAGALSFVNSLLTPPHDVLTLYRLAGMDNQYGDRTTRTNGRVLWMAATARMNFGIMKRREAMGDFYSYTETGNADDEKLSVEGKKPQYPNIDSLAGFTGVDIDDGKEPDLRGLPDAEAVKSPRGRGWHIYAHGYRPQSFALREKYGDDEKRLRMDLLRRNAGVIYNVLFSEKLEIAFKAGWFDVMELVKKDLPQGEKIARLKKAHPDLRYVADVMFSGGDIEKYAVVNYAPPYVIVLDMGEGEGEFAFIGIMHEGGNFFKGKRKVEGVKIERA